VRKIFSSVEEAAELEGRAGEVVVALDFLSASGI
jgi:hypothetical protein